MENMNQVRLETPRLVLRDIELRDAKCISDYANNLNVSRYMALLPYPYALSDGQFWVNKCLEERVKGPERSSFSLGITIKGDDSMVGGISVGKIDRLNGTAGMGYWLGEPYWRRGFMFEAAKGMLDFAFGELGLRRIDISAVIENDASNALIRKLGFVQEGMQRQKMVSKATGKIHDLNIYGLLRSEWAVLQQNKE